MRFEKPKGQRLHKRFLWIGTTDYDLWWDETLKEWVTSQERIGQNMTGPYSTCCSCKSLKSFKRHLKKHPKIKGKAVLVNKFAGYNVYA